MFLGFCFSICLLSVQALSVILVPKEHQLHTFDFETFNKEHAVKRLASVGDLNVYRTDVDNYNQYQGTFDNLFDVEQEQEYTTQESNAPWHLDRIARQHLPLDGTYPYSHTGSCHRNPDIEIHTYVVDTGCDVTHPEFEGRAEFLENFTNDGEDFDGNSHGSHCSGIIGSKTYGVCKDAKIFCVKVLDAEGSGSTSGVIAGMNYVFKRHQKQPSNVRSIMSMSLGGGYSGAMNRVVERMAKSSDTFYIAVAAGNEDQDACKTSPASARGIFTVMAMDKNDDKAYFSNYGKCASVYAPGVNIESTVPNGKTAVYSGTSMSTPNLAGVLNHYIDQYPQMNMKQIKEKLLEDATKDTIENNPDNTPNLMVYLHREE